MTPEELERFRKLQEHVAELDANDKAGVRWERDIRRAISNTGRLPCDIYGVLAFYTPDGELFSRCIIAHDASGPDRQAILAAVDERQLQEAIEHLLKRTACGYGAALSALLREIQGKTQLMPPEIGAQFVQHVLDQALAGMERTNEDSEAQKFLKSIAAEIFGRK